MKTDKQRLNDFKADKKALKKEYSAAKKDVSKAKSAEKKNAKQIAKAEREIGHWYYLEQKRSTAEGRRKLKQLCAVISTAEQEINRSSEVREICGLRMKHIKEEIKAKKNALKQSEVDTVDLNVN